MKMTAIESHEYYKYHLSVHDLATGNNILFFIMNNLLNFWHQRNVIYIQIEFHWAPTLKIDKFCNNENNNNNNINDSFEAYKNMSTHEERLLHWTKQTPKWKSIKTYDFVIQSKEMEEKICNRYLLENKTFNIMYKCRKFKTIWNELKKFYSFLFEQLTNEIKFGNHLYLNGPFILDNDATISYEMQSVSNFCCCCVVMGCYYLEYCNHYIKDWIVTIQI